MKKSISSLALIFLGTMCFAQLRVGVQAGASVVGPNLTVTGTSVNYSDKGFTFVYPGLIFDYQVGKAFSIRPSANFLQTGYDLTSTLGTLSTNSKVRINNVQVPLDLVVPIKLGKGKLELSAGPTLSFSLNGTSTTTGAGITTPVQQDLKFGNDTLSLNAINWGTNFGAGYRFKNGVGIRAMYNLALTDQANAATVVNKYNVLTATISYFLIGNNNK
ncbi:MAG: hypothetical protein RL660_799 [Bacteroidota bacterium]